MRLVFPKTQWKHVKGNELFYLVNHFFLFYVETVMYIFRLHALIGRCFDHMFSSVMSIDNVVTGERYQHWWSN